MIAWEERSGEPEEQIIKQVMDVFVVFNVVMISCVKTFPLYTLNVFNLLYQLCFSKVI